MQIDSPERLEPVAGRRETDDHALGPSLDAACRRLMRGGSKSFFAASLLLPSRVRGPATALYAFCRVADDAVDTGDDPVAAIAELHRRLDAIYAGRPAPIDADRAFAAVIAAHALPRPLIDALLDGFAWDAGGRRYATLADVQSYAARVAGTVGAMMALLMGVRDPVALARACELGVAMQLTNIARDVGEDARNGRLYLPTDWLREVGVDPAAWLADPRPDPRVGAVVGRLLGVADTLYQRAEQGVAMLPRDCRAAIQAARLVYAEIGREVERRSLDSVSSRAVVGLPRKLALLARAGLAGIAAPRRGQGATVPLRAIAFLVEDACAAPAVPTLRVDGIPDRPIDQRIGWLLELFERQATPGRFAR